MTLRHILTIMTGFNIPPTANPDATLVVDAFDDAQSGPPPVASPVAPTVSPLTTSDEEEPQLPPSLAAPERIGCVKHLGYCPRNCPNFKPGQWDRASETSADNDEDDKANEVTGEDDDETGESASDGDDDVLEYVKIGCAKHLNYCDKACPRYWYQFAPEHRPQEPAKGTKRKRTEEDDEPETTSKRRRCAAPLGRDRILWAMARRKFFKP